MRIATSFVLAALFTLVAAEAIAEPLLVNGSFEEGPLAELWATGQLGAHDVDVFAGTDVIPGWTVFGSTIDMLGPAWAVSDGVHAIDLDGRDATLSGVSQTFATDIGRRYVVSFDLSGNTGGGELTKRLRASAGDFIGDYSWTLTPGSSLWQRAEFAFVASDTTATISFMSLSDTPSSYGALLDNVEVSSVPEPSTLALIGLALVGVAARSRRGARSLTGTR